MRTYLSIAGAVAARHLYKWISIPSNFIPTFIFPLVFFTSFAGGLTRVGSVPGFDYGSYESFIFIFSLLQTCMFGGLATGFTIAGDFQSGFMRRLMVVARFRTAILLGFIISTFVRAMLMSVVVTLVALVIGMEIAGSFAELTTMYLLAVLMSIIGTLWAAGVMFRARSPQVAPAMQIPMFVAIFLAPVYVPLDLLDGWLKAVATVNPVTYIMEAERSLLAGTPDGVGLAVGLIAAGIVLFGIWGVRGVRSAARAG